MLAFVFAVTKHLRVMDRWLEAPWLLVFPAIGALRPTACGGGAAARLAPYAMAVVIFLAAYLTLVGSLAFHDPLLGDDLGCRSPAAIAQLPVLRRGAPVVFPVVLIYTVAVYWIFRGKGMMPTRSSPAGSRTEPAERLT